MAVCARCGQENPGGFRFCGACGHALAEPRELRKVVTVLFCDLSGSTELGDRSDPETLRRAMAGYYERMRAIVERHGGTVEKFVGDAVMAVFGIPQAHEDDALRAVRAADEMSRAVDELGLRVHIGINTGRVVAGEGETLVTGDAVNVAARLEQHAGDGEILLGDETYRLVRDAVVTEPARLTVKGKPEPVDAHRLVALDAAAPAVARRLDAPLVGRERERRRLRDEFEDVVAESTCRLLTLVGAAGVGKSRLVADFLEGCDADVVSGRCLDYGEGITYWPMVEVVLQLGADPATILGTSTAETQLAFRKLLESKAAERPLVVVFDDLHWAEPTFLEVVEHVVDWSRDVPLFLLCIARPELVDVRPTWGGGKANASSLALEPLRTDDAARLVENLLDGAELPHDARERVLAAAAGNPLFVEEMVALAREDGELRVPPTIHALLEARLDRLSPAERSIVDRGAVEGEVFHLGPLGGAVDDASNLATLVRKDVVRPSPAQFHDEEAFRFRHILLRDAAYEALPKRERAALHADFAAWLDSRPWRLVEHDELVGWHLEQAVSYREELGDDEQLGDLRAAAADHLGRAGFGALGRGDFNGATTLLDRAVALLPAGDAHRLELLPEVYRAAVERGDWGAAEAAVSELESASDATSATYGRVLRIELEASTGTVPPLDDLRVALQRDADVLHAAGNVRGVIDALRIQGHMWWHVCRAAEAADVFERVAALAQGRDDTRGWSESMGMIAACLAFGPTPAREAERRLDELRAEADGDVLLEAGIDRGRSRIAAQQGATDRARELWRGSVARLLDAGAVVVASASAQTGAFIEERAGDLEAAERLLRESSAELVELGDGGYRSTSALELAGLLLWQDRLEEAAEWTALARAATSGEDAFDLFALDALDGAFAAAAGDAQTALRSNAAAVARADATDFFQARVAARRFRAWALNRLGDTGGARQAMAEAIAIAEAKGDVAGAARDTAWLATLA